jgi:tetratricopeptide (TPR) repeat protein
MSALLIAVGLLAATAWGQEASPPQPATPKLSEADRVRLGERDRHRVEAVRLAISGKLDQAVREAEAALAINRAVLGEFGEGVAESLDLLAYLHEDREDWAAARKAREGVLALRERQPGRKDWRVDDARRALADYERRTAMDPEQRRRLTRARGLTALAKSEHARGRYRAALPSAIEALAILKERLGERHPDYATSLDNLAGLYLYMDDYVRARPLASEALAKIVRFASDSATVLGERQRLRLLGRLRGHLDIYISVSPMDTTSPTDLYRDVLA